jgi:CRP/FNR family transcriptional regulator, cyclic AMP receptor protein
MKTIRDLLAEQPLFADLPADDLDFIAGCGHNVHVPAGQPIVRHDGAADHFYLLRTGRAQLEIEQPGRGSLIAETLLPGAIIGISWLFPPYRYSFDAIATEPCDLIAVDAGCLRTKCETEPRLGHLLMKRFAGLLIDRLHHLQLQLLDLYSADTGATR